MAAQNKPNFALFTCKARKFSMSSVDTFSILTNQINDTVNGFACVVYVFRACIMQSIRCKMALFRKLKAKMLENGGMVE